MCEGEKEKKHLSMIVHCIYELHGHTRMIVR